MPKIVKFTSIDIQLASNGASIDFTVVKESEDTFEDRDFRRMEMVFEDKENSLGLDMALAKMRELFMFNKAMEDKEEFSMPSIDGAKIKS